MLLLRTPGHEMGEMKTLHRDARPAKPMPRPLVFVVDDDIPTTVRAMKAGAVEFLHKPYGQTQLLEAVREALAKSEAALAAQESSRGMRAAYDSLTPREREVMGMVVTGLLNKQVGGQLGI